MHTVIIYEAVSDTVIVQPDGSRLPVKAGHLIAYDTADSRQFPVDEQEVIEKYVHVHNGQYIRKDACRQEV